MTIHRGGDAPVKEDQKGVTRRVGILTTDTDLVVKSWDAALEQMTGIRADLACGRRLHDLVPDLGSRGLDNLLREPLVSGAAQVLAPALHKFLIPCPPLEPSTDFDRMQQRVSSALWDEQRAVGLVVAIEDVTARPGARSPNCATPIRRRGWRQSSGCRGSSRRMVSARFGAALGDEDCAGPRLPCARSPRRRRPRRRDRDASGRAYDSRS
jgi:hypothetical protein